MRETTELPRSRALVRLDGPGHIMPVEPVTPPDSAIWRIVHFPVVLGAVAVVLLVLASVATGLIGMVFRASGHVPGARFLVPALGAAAVLGVYWVFVRVVERRRDFAELGKAGLLTEMAAGVSGGLVLAVAIFGIVYLMGGFYIVGVNPASVLLQPVFSALCAAIVQELILRGILFRLAERLIGSWLAILLIMVGFGAVALVHGQWDVLASMATVLQAGLLFTALYMVTRRLWAAIGLHAVWNLAQFALFGVGTVTAGPRPFLVLLATGPTWLTGGVAGAGASAPGLALTALLSILLLATAIRRGHIVRPAWRRGRY